MKSKRKTQYDDQWDEIMHSWYREQDRFIEKLKYLGIDWAPTSFEEQRVALLRRLQVFPPLTGLSLSDEQTQMLALWIEGRVDDEVCRIVDLCLKRFLI